MSNNSLSKKEKAKQVFKFSGCTVVVFIVIVLILSWFVGVKAYKYITAKTPLMIDADKYELKKLFPNNFDVSAMTMNNQQTVILSFGNERFSDKVLYFQHLE